MFHSLISRILPCLLLLVVTASFGCSSTSDALILNLTQQLQSDNRNAKIDTLVQLAMVGYKSKEHTGPIGEASETVMETASFFQGNDPKLSRIATATWFIIDPIGPITLDPRNHQIIPGLALMAEMNNQEMRAVALEAIGMAVLQYTAAISSPHNNTGTRQFLIASLRGEDYANIDMAIEVSIKQLSNQDIAVRRSAALALGALAGASFYGYVPIDERVSKALESVISDNDPLVRGFSKLGKKAKSDKDADTKLAAAESERRFKRFFQLKDRNHMYLLISLFGVGVIFFALIRYRREGVGFWAFIRKWRISTYLSSFGLILLFLGFVLVSAGIVLYYYVT